MRLGRTNRSAIYVSVCVFLAILTVVAAGSLVAGASGEEIVVDPNGGDADTIQEGIDMAEDGDTVLVRDGTYDESVVVDKSVRVVAENDATLDRNGAEGTAFTIGNDTRALEDVVIDGFTIRNYAQDGNDPTTGSGVLVVDDVTNVTVANNEISNVEAIGVGALNDGGQQHEINVVDNEIHGADGAGIGVRAIDDAATSEILVAGNEITDVDGNAVVMEAADGGDVDDITVAGTQTESVTNGAQFFTGGGSTVSGLNVTSNDFSGASDTGLQFSSGPEGVITDVDVADTAVYGAGTASVSVFTDGKFERVSFENVAANDSQTGFQANFGESAQVSDLQFESVTVSDATDAGIRISATDSASVDGISLTEIDASGTANDGVRINSDEDAIVENVDLETVDLRDTGGAAVFAAGNSSTLSDVDIREIVVTGSDRGVTVDAGWDDTHDATVSNVSITDSGLNGTDEAGLNLNAFGSSTVEDVGLDTVAAGDNDVGIRAFSGDDATVSDVSIVSTMANANQNANVELIATEDSTIHGITLEEALLNETADGSGVDMIADNGSIHDVSLDTVVIDNNDQGVGILAFGSGSITDVELDTVIVQHSTGDGLVVYTDDTATLTNIDVRESLIRENEGDGLYVGEHASASEISVHYSFLARNDAAGVYNANADEAVDARFNYWGDGSGPASPTTDDLVDPVTDKPAYGSGAEITEGQDGVANVRFSPAIGAKADQREQMIPLPELAGDELADEFEFEVDGVSINEPMTFEVDGETITGTPTDFVGLSAWERSVLPLRTDRTDGATVVDLPQVIINTDDGDVPANLDSLAVYNVDDTVTVDFEQVTGAQTDKFADTPAHMIVVHADSEEAAEMIRNGELQDELVDEIEAEIEAKADDGLDENTGQVNVSIDGIDVVEIKQVDDLDENGETSTTFTPEETGEYAFLLGTIETGDGFTEHDDEDLSFNVFNDTVGIVGVEGMSVQRTSSSVTAPSETSAGDEVEFTADSNLVADKVTHAILAYDKEAFESDSITIDETDVEELSDDVFRLTSSGERAGEAFFLETTVDTADLDDGEFKLTIHGTVADSDGTFEAIIDEDGEVEVLEDSFEGDELDISVHDDGVVTGQLDGIHFSLGVVADGDSVETISMPLGEHADIDEDDTETYQWIHAAVDQDDTDERSSSANTIDVSGTVDPAVNVVDATLNRTSIETGEAVELTVEVDNPGDAEATDDVVITVDDNEVTTWPVTLGAGETDTETFTLRFSVEGEYEVAANDVIAGTVIVSESDTDPDPDPDPDPRPWPTPSPTVSVTERVGGASITVTNLPQGQTIQIDAGTSISAGGATVTGYAANTTRDMDSLDIEIDSNETVPEGTPELNLGTAFSYINVDTGGLTDDDFENVQWQFTVEQAKLDERDRTPEDVRLFRYSVADNEWQELPTEHVGGEEYTADAPGFSVFAVGTVGQSDIEVVDAELAEETVEVDETFTTTATVENSGDADGEYTAELEVDGQVVDSQEVTVAAGESETVEFTHTIDDVGSYEISVNGVVAGTLEVEAAPTPTPTPDTPTPDTPTETPETPDPDPAAPSVLFAGFIAMILFVAGGLGIYYYREDRFPWEADTAAAGADPFSAFDDEGAGDDTGSGNGDGSTNTRTDDAPDPLADEGDASDGSEEDQRT